MRLPILIVVFLVFTIWSTTIGIEHGPVGFLTMAAKGGWELQVFLDLVIALSLFSIWLKRDARALGIASWPWMLATLTLGSVGALAYLIYRELKKKQATTTT
ncbi:MAG: DUF2834 domain-containing protein [Deltaproteobacteria bacterium]|nr:DUF2834 domain-containing protein [Deltaproteobacteria bacterium]